MVYKTAPSAGPSWSREKKTYRTLLSKEQGRLLGPKKRGSGVKRQRDVTTPGYAQTRVSAVQRRNSTARRARPEGGFSLVKKRGERKGKKGARRQLT